MLIFFTLACVLNRTHQSVHMAMLNDVQTMAEDVDNLERQFDSMSVRISDIEELTRSRGQSEILSMDSTEQLRMELANLRNDIEQLQFSFQKTESLAESTSVDSVYRLTWLESRAEQLETELGVNPPSPPTSPVLEEDESTNTSEVESEEVVEPPPPTEPDLSPDELISKAEEHLKAGRAKAAESLLKKFIEKHSDHKRYAEGLYRYAEAAFNNGDFKQAASRYQKVIDYNKKGPWAPWAMLFQGDCFRESGRPKNAKVFYEAVVEDYPNSKAAKDAKARLKE